MKSALDAIARVKFLSFETVGVATLATGVLIACFVFSPDAAAADEGVEAAGKNRYMDYCAVCHGADGKGGGPFATMLKKAPPDLTMLSKNAGGTFPFYAVFETIDGRGASGAHGTADMPIWGAEWKVDNVVGATAVRGRILEMIIFLRSIQQ